MATLREKSTWTPKSHPPSNQKIFQERMTLIRKWYSAWDEDQRWNLLEYLLRQQNDAQLLVIHQLLHPAMPPPDHDFTRVLPRYLTLRILSLLDPQSLCRAAQVCWYWKFLAEANCIWQRKCLKLGWFLPTPPIPFDYSVWKRHYIACVCQLHWIPPQAPAENDILDESIYDPEESLRNNPNTRKTKKRVTGRRHTLSVEERGPWRDPDRVVHDIEYQYSALHGVQANALPLALRNQQDFQVTGGATLTENQLGVSGALPTQPAKGLPPLDSLMHPVLLEKMRLGSPSVTHSTLTTLNNNQTEQDIHEALYDLHKVNPFPKLPPYFVHKKEQLQSRPPSGRQHKEHKSVKPKSSAQVNTWNSGQLQSGLRSRAWSLPHDSDDES